MIGQRISHYQILEKLGPGGMGVVYKAEDVKLLRHVALKFLPQHVSRDSQAVQRFIREAQTASALDHQNICTIHEISETDEGQLFIVMTFYEGETLKQMMRHGALKVEQAVAIAQQLCLGLQQAHAKGVIHRDIKPANIMITNDGVVKILDFGLAKLVDVNITKTGSTLGTIAYMSPEQTMGREVDERTDIWSVGVVLYEMLTGLLPFKGDFEQAVIYSILNEEPEPLGLYLPDMPDLEKMTKHCLEKQSLHRYQHIKELHKDLSRFEACQNRSSLRIKSRPLSFKRRAVAPKVLWSIIILLVVSVAFLLFEKFRQKPVDVTGDDKRISIAILYFENETGVATLDHWRKALADLLITDLSQSRYFQVLSGDRLYHILDKHHLLDVQQYSSELLKLIAQDARVDHVLVGQYTKAGDNIRINTALHCTSSGNAQASSVEGVGESQMFRMIDHLSTKLKSSFHLSESALAEDMDENIGKITTSSAEAFRCYSQGQKFYLKGDQEQCIAWMQKALKIDPDFAMAHWAMAQSYAEQGFYAHGYHEKRLEHIQHALDKSNRLSEREKLHIQAEFYAATDKTWSQAIDTYLTLLEHYPYDLDAHKKLGYLYYNIEQWQSAVDQLRYSMDQFDEDTRPYACLAFALVRLNRFDDARRVLDFYRTEIEDGKWIHMNLANLFIYQGALDAALIEIDKASSMSDDGRKYILSGGRFVAQSDFKNDEKGEYVLLGDIALYLGDFKKAKEYYDFYAQQDSPTAQQYYTWLLTYLDTHEGKFKSYLQRVRTSLEFEIKQDNEKRKMYQYGYLSRFYMTSGNARQALIESKKGEELAIKTEFLWGQQTIMAHIGIAYAGLGQFDQAEATAAALLNSLDSSVYKPRKSHYYLLLGYIDYFKGNYDRAIDFIKQSIALNHPNAMFLCESLNLLGDAYQKAERLDLAQEQYERIISLTVGKRFLGDIATPAHYKLAQIYEQKGWENKAVEQYIKFAELWQDCDPELQHFVEDAKTRIRVLQDNE